MLLNWISLELDITAALTVWFAVFIINMKFALGYWTRRLLRIKQTKGIKLLDCVPCQSFWIALAVTFNPVVAMAVYLMAVLSVKK